MSVLNDISTLMQQGRAKDVKQLTQQAVDEGYSAEQILEEGLISAMDIVGVKFKNNEVYVPEVLIAARAMKAGMEILTPLLKSGDFKPKGKAVVGTVKGDLHDIGKNLVCIMFEGKGIEVVDLGVDVPAETFVDRALELNAQIIGASTLLTTNMGVMKEIVEYADEKGVRDKVKIMIGGAPVNQEFCNKIGADFYTENAAEASTVALSICEKS